MIAWKTFAASILSTSFVLVLFSSMSGTPSSLPAPTVQGEIETGDVAGRQQKTTGWPHARIAMHPGTGMVRFLGATPGRPISRPAPVSQSAPPEEAARSFLAVHGAPFGLVDQARELVAVRERAAGKGRTFVRFQQVHDEIPVFGGEIVVQLTAQNNIISVNGEILPNIALDVVPAIDGTVAAQTAVDAAAEWHGLGSDELAPSEPSLWIYEPILVGPKDGETRLVWRIEVSAQRLLPISELVLIDAHDGSVVLHFNQIGAALERRTFTADSGSILPGRLLCDESNPLCSGQSVDAVNAHRSARDTYQFYAVHHGRDSIDNAGLPITSTVEYCEFSCPYLNAFWDETTLQMVFGAGIAVDDVVAHEFTHGVTQYESGLFYYEQSGAINESFSDLWGEFVDLSYNYGEDSPAERWLISEEETSGGIRNMKDPTTFVHPDRITSPYYYTGSADNGGVHTNSGVNNKAVYLMTDGDTFNGITVSGLGITKTAAIYYEVQTNLATSASDYADLYELLYQACLNLVGSSGIIPGDCQQVRSATNAVEMNQQPPPYTLLIVKTGSGSGSVTSTPAGIQCGTDCQEVYYTPTDITLTAQSGAGSVFAGWNGACSDSLPTCTVTVDNDESIEARFAACNTLTLSHIGMGSDPIATPSNSPGCAAGEYVTGQTINLSATPDIGWQVSAWTGTANDSSTGSTNSVVMPSDTHEVQVIYSSPPQVTVVKVVEGSAPLDDWEYEGSSGVFTLPASGGSVILPSLDLGTYVITETTKNGFAASAACTDGTTGTSTVAVDLSDPSADVTCTFTNTALPATLIITKVVEGVSATDWTFEGDQGPLSELTEEGGTDHVWSPDGTKIAFISGRDGNFELYVMNADGSGETRLTQSLAREDDPTWSPDSSQIAFAATRGSNYYNLYVVSFLGIGTPVSVTESTLVTLTQNDGILTSPKWSPIDPDLIAFVHDPDGDGNTDVYVVSPDGSSAPTRIVTDTDYNADLSFSPDGSWIAFQTGNSLAKVTPDGSTKVSLVTRSAYEAPAEGPYSWSPDGSMIAFVSYPTPSTQHLYRTSAISETEPITLTAVAVYGTKEPVWSPDGTRVVFHRNGDLYSVPVYGATEGRLTSHWRDDTNPKFHANPCLLSFESNRHWTGGYNVYTLDLCSTVGSFQIDRAGGQYSTTVVAGSYTVTETPGAGFAAQAQCSDGANGGNSVSVSLSPGAVVGCVFTNTQLGQITVIKRSVGGSGSFGFGGDLGSFVLVTTPTNDTASQTFSSRMPGVYAITESVPIAWNLAGATCDTGEPPDAFVLQPGGHVTCIFTNTLRTGAIVLTKTLVGPAPPSDWQFTGLGQTIAISGSGGTVSRTVDAGVYVITETARSGYAAAVTCDDGSSGTYSVAATVLPGATIGCTFTNTKLAQLTIEKTTVGADGTFGYTGTLGAFSLTTAGGVTSTTFADLLPGVYAITETAKPGWEATAATCDNGNAPGAVTLGPDASVTCTFTNTKLAEVTIEKRAVGGDGTFAYTGTLGSFSLTTTGGVTDTTLANLPPGIYAVSETIQTGWIASATACDNGDSPGALSLMPGATVRCTFTNTKLAQLTLTKNAIGGDGVFVYTGTLGTFSLTTAGGITDTLFPNLIPGLYVIDEIAQTGWENSPPVCSNGDSPDALSLTPGAHVTCSFTNTKLAHLTLVKRALGGDGAFNFNGSLGSFSLTTSSGITNTVFANLLPGPYSISETVGTDWRLVTAACDNGNDPESILLGAGANVTCTFTNTKPAQLTVVKQTLGGDGAFVFVGSLGAFSLTTTGGITSSTFSGLAPGLYAISETAQAGWQATAATCDTGDAPDALTLGAGTTATCTFTNTRTAQLTVVKQTLGGDGAFVFTGTVGTFGLTTSGGTASTTFASLLPGNHSITETLPSGWDQVAASCSNGDAPAAITLVEGANVTCTFTNTVRPGNLTIQKATEGGDGTFVFTGTLGTFSLTTSSGVTSTTYSDLPPGTYSISEIVPPGWSQTSATCDNGDAPASVTVGPGVGLTCTFTNTKLSQLAVEKRSVGGDGTFVFTGTLGTFSLTTIGGVTSTLFTELAPGTFSLAEVTSDGWEQSGASCDNGDSVSAIGLGAGTSTRCTFTNTALLGSLTVRKVSDGGDGVFPFTGTLGTFSLTTVGGVASAVFSGLSAGTYNISETVPAGWTLTEAVCDNGDVPAAVTIGSSPAVTCTFTNTRQSGTVVIQKITEPPSEVVFGFGKSLGDATGFSLSHGEVLTFTDVPVGPETVFEDSPELSGYALTALSCTDSNPNGTASSGDVDSHTADIYVDAGETVICTFTSTRRSGNLTIQKATEGGDGTFVFTGTLGTFSLTTSSGVTSTTYSDLPPGAYSISEIVPPGWSQTSATCDNGDAPASVTVGPGVGLTCTFTNTKLSQLAVEKRSVGGDGTFVFTGTLGTFSLTTIGGVSDTLFSNLPPGRYDIREESLPGWTHAISTCDNGDDPSAVILAPGTSVRCTFTNTMLAQLAIVKHAVGNDDTFVFTGTLGTFSLTTIGGVTSTLFTELAPGTFSLAEVTSDGWEQSGASCDNGDSVSAIGLGAGTSTRCTFTNTALLGSLTVRKVSDGGDGVFPFTGTLGAFSLTTVGGVASAVFSGLSAGTYNISETVPAGWTLTEAVCDNGDVPAAVTIGSSPAVTCTFTNTLVKATSGADLAVTVCCTESSDIEPTQGLPIYFSINVINHGPDTAHNVTVLVSEISPYTTEPLDPTQGTCDIPSKTCNLGMLAIGESASVNAEVAETKPEDPFRAYQGISAEIQVKVSSDEDDPDPANNSASAAHYYIDCKRAQCLLEFLLCYPSPKYNPRRAISARSPAAADFVPFLPLYYDVRDALITTVDGQSLVSQYNTHGSEVFDLMQGNQDVWGQSLSVLELWEPNIRALVNGEGDQVMITGEQVLAVQNLLDTLSAAGSPELRNAIADELDRLPPLDELIGMTMEEAKYATVGAALFLPNVLYRSIEFGSRAAQVEESASDEQDSGPNSGERSYLPEISR